MFLRKLATVEKHCYLEQKKLISAGLNFRNHVSTQVNNTYDKSLVIFRHFNVKCCILCL